MVDRRAIVALVAKALPAVLPRLKSGALRLCLKTEGFFEGIVERLIMDLYYGYIDGSTFIDIFYSLISGQLTDAYQSAWEEDNQTEAIPDYLEQALKEAIVAQQDHVQGFADAIIQASVDDKPIDPLLARASLWSNEWTSQYNHARQLIAAENPRGKLIWVEGDTEDKCDTCLALDGIVAYATEWEALGVRPQNAPNDHLLCGGWRCGCQLKPTTERKTPNAYEKIAGIVG